VLALLLVVVTPATAAPAVLRPYETNTAVPAANGFPDDFDCDELVGWACFEYYGDRLWVMDELDDNGSLDLQWQNQLWTGSKWDLYRHGSCITDYTYPLYEWQTCNKDFYESSSTNYYGAQGSRVRWRVCDPYDYCYAWTSWHNNNR
jgi:hypothetical protein